MTGRSDFTPLVEHSRFPVSVLDDSCATEGAAHEPVSFEEGQAAMESDPWIFWAVVAGVIGAMLLSVAFPMGVLS
jgi:hypothetical protein